jgi:hypothetical protein
MSFLPENSRLFVYREVKFDPETGELAMQFDLDDIEFIETIKFPPGEPVDSRGFSEATKLLFLTCGLSYYKLAAPGQIAIDVSITKQASQMLQALLIWGMAEFTYRNELPALAPDFDVEFVDALPSQIALSEGTIIPVGGGKDSIVTLHAIQAKANDVTLLGVRDFAPIHRTAAIAELPLLTIDRTIDPLVSKMQAEGGYAGHVPATAVISLIAVTAALQQGKRTVVMSNERSASEGNIVIEGLEINHQYSKSKHFEQILQQVIAETVNSDLEWFSLLRPFSELSIAKKFSSLTQYHQSFLSCNRAFVLDESKRLDKWCGNCSKCVFVYLALANFMDRDNLNSIFGHDVLNQPENISFVENLSGVTGNKPFECVGEQRESRAALRSLAESDEWKSDLAVTEVSSKLSAFEDPPLEAFLIRAPETDLIPDRWKDTLDEIR